MTCLVDIQALISDSRTQLDELVSVYEDSLRERQVPASLQVHIKTIVDLERSALDYLAHAIVAGCGVKGSKTYYPMADSAADFAGRFDRDMPGVSAKMPEVRAIIEKWQPFDQPWIAVLSKLSRENKHQRLTPQVRVETPRRVDEGPRGTVSWDPRSVSFGEGVYINGRPVDPTTQRTSATRNILYVDWLFEGLGVSAIGALREIAEGLHPLLVEVADAAGLSTEPH